MKLFTEMKILKCIFGKSNNVDQEERDLPEDFRGLIIKAIELIGRDSKVMDDQQLYHHLVSKGINNLEAVELLIFLPTSFCRKLLPDLNWPSTYFDYFSEHKKIRRAYDHNKRYIMMQEETETYWNENPDKEWLINIAGRSAEFHAINKLINDGGKLEDVILSESYVLRKNFDV